MKITFFIGSLYGGGAERVVCNISNFLREFHAVEVITMSGKCVYKLDSSVKHIVLEAGYEKCGFLKKNLIRFKRLKEYMKSSDTDVYIVMLPITIIMLMVLKKYTSAKIIISERNNPSSYRPMIRLLLKHFAKKADAFVFQTETARFWYALPQKIKTVIIPNAINKDFLGIQKSGQRKKVIVGVGRLNKQKNFKLLIDAFALSIDKIPGYTLEIYGDGPLREELSGYISTLKINENVFIKGYSTDIKKDIKDASAFVLSSDYEGIPNSLLEALAIGVPCISTDCGGGGAKLLIKNGVNGILVPKGDKKALSNAIIDIVVNAEKSEAMADEAQKLCERYSPGEIYGEWKDFIEDI